MASVAPTVVRCGAVEAVVQGQPLTDALIAQAADAVGQDISPIDDVRSTRGYRLAVARNVVATFLRTLRDR